MMDYTGTLPADWKQGGYFNELGKFFQISLGTANNAFLGSGQIKKPSSASANQSSC